jgi:hypothetical protein
MSLVPSRSLYQLSRQLLGSFLHDLANLDPWWVSIVSPVNGDHKTTLADLLGFEHEVALDFPCSAGLLKVGQKNSFSVLYEEWELFII